jgi:hypothetical protein
MIPPLIFILGDLENVKSVPNKNWKKRKMNEKTSIKLK